MKDTIYFDDNPEKLASNNPVAGLLQKETMDECE